MFIVGLTGGLATGKSTVLSIFRDNGIAVIDADEVGRKVLEPGTSAWKEVKSSFGGNVLNPDGKINRLKLGEVIFEDIEKRKKLNAITHPKIQKAMMLMALKYFFSGHKYIVMEVPLLFETGKMLTYMHKIITVTCDDKNQLGRLCERNDMSVKVALKRIQAQMPLKYKVENSHFVINNNGDRESTKIQTLDIMKQLNRSKFNWYFRTIVGMIILSIIFGMCHVAWNLCFNKAFMI